MYICRPSLPPRARGVDCNTQPITTSPNSLPAHLAPSSIQQVPADHPTLTRIAELERQLAELRAATRHKEPLLQLRPLGILYPTQTLIAVDGQSASVIVDLVEIPFPRVEWSTMGQIIENSFKPTCIASWQVRKNAQKPTRQSTLEELSSNTQSATQMRANTV